MQVQVSLGVEVLLLVHVMAEPRHQGLRRSSPGVLIPGGDLNLHAFLQRLDGGKLLDTVASGQEHQGHPLKLRPADAGIRDIVRVRDEDGRNRRSG